MVEVHSQIRAVADGWDELAEGVGALPWIRPGWVEAWLDAFGGRPEIYVKKGSEGLDGVLPLVRRGSVLVSPTNWHTPAFAPVVRDVETTTELLQAVLRTKPRRLDLRFLPEESISIEALLAEGVRGGYRVLGRVATRSPYISLDGSWEDYEKRLTRKLRNDLRRCRRRLEEHGSVSIEIDTGEERLEPLLEEGFGIEGSGWKDRKGTAISSQAQTDQFYRAVARWARDRGWLRMAFLRVDGDPVAFDLLLEVNDVLYDMKGGYRRDFARYSPGKILLRELLSRAFARQLARFEFLGEGEPYKLAWTSTTQQRWVVQAFAPSMTGVAEWVAFHYGRPFVKKMLSVVR
jgi:CelD/BcsL family acetyltransferase involved in cellulose biosynthesis